MNSASQQRTHWLLEADSSGTFVDAGGQLSISSEAWRATVESIDVDDGLRVFLTEADVRSESGMEPSHESPGPWFATNVLLKGQVRMTFPDGPEATVDTRQTLMFHPAERRARYTVSGGQKIRIAGYRMSRDRLGSMLGGRVPAPMEALLAPEHAETRLLALPTTGQIRRAAQAIFSTPLTGNLRAAYLEGAVLQLLALQSAAATTDGDSDASGPPISPGVRRKVHEARERLLSDLRRPPSLREMAAGAGMSEKALNATFRRLFGATVFETLRSERLDHARIVLERDDLPLKLLAARVGYRHVSNFISAFTARFGAAPRQYLRNRSDRRWRD